jgi:hypothetical protein
LQIQEAQLMASVPVGAPAPVIAPTTQFIFQLHWYNTIHPTIPANQMQDVPGGGWGNWTMAHNVNWMRSKIALREKFVLLGNLNDLRAQGNNAGTGKNQCVIGAEVLILIYAGYVGRAPSGAGDEAGYAVRVFDYVGPAHTEYDALCNWASTQDLHISYSPPAVPGGFWIPWYKQVYLYALG